MLLLYFFFLFFWCEERITLFMFAIHLLLLSYQTDILSSSSNVCVAKGASKLKEESNRSRQQAEEKKRKEEPQHQKNKTKANKVRPQPPPSLHVSLHPSQILCLATKSLKARSVISSFDLSPYPLTIPNTEKVPWIQGTSVLSHLITMIYPRNSQRCSASST